MNGVVNAPDGPAATTSAPAAEQSVTAVAPARHSPTATWLDGMNPEPLTSTVWPSPRPVSGVARTVGAATAGESPPVPAAAGPSAAGTGRASGAGSG